MEKKSENVSISLSAAPLKGDETLVMATVNTPEGSGPSACDVVCVVDVSGSMSTEAKTQNSKGDVEAHGLSILDIVKHAVKTIVNILQNKDRLSLVVFSTEARTIFNLIDMNDAGKKRALSEIEKLSPENSTNIWGGLKMGLDVLKNSDNKDGHIQSVLILTDGQPNVIPPEGHLPALKKYKDENAHLKCSINTFGFGYNLDSNLLQELAIEGDGMYAFIPDSGFVGTAFVHSISNQLVTIATGSQLSIEPMNGASLVEHGVIGGYPSQYSTWGAQVRLGSIQYGQPRNILFRVKVKSDSDKEKPFVSFVLKYGSQEAHAEANQNIIKSLEGEIEVQYNRLQAVDAIRNAHTTCKSNASSARNSIKSFIADVKASPSAKTDQRVKDLLADLEGQVTEAISKDEFFSKWGTHYLPSLLNAHLFQMCNNFKDPGVQVYGGKLFSQQRDRADDIFVKLPPPKPSHKTSAPVQSMSYYHSSGNPCFHGNSLAKMSNGSLKRIADIKKGNQVSTPSGNAKVICVVKTHCPGTTHLVELGNGLLVTPFHPVRVLGKWAFPESLGEVKERPCDAVYNFVLDGGHVMTINGIECVTLGHDFQEEVVKHVYFGSQRIVEDLKKMRGWNNGFIELQSGCLVRDTTTSLVSGIHQSPVLVA